MHRNARLTPQGRLLLCQRVEAGWPVAHAAESMGISRDRAYIWWRRYRAEGLAGLEDRSSPLGRCPNTRTKASRERRIVSLRLGRPGFLGAVLPRESAQRNAGIFFAHYAPIRAPLANLGDFHKLCRISRPRHARCRSDGRSARVLKAASCSLRGALWDRPSFEEIASKANS